MWLATSVLNSSKYVTGYLYFSETVKLLPHGLMHEHYHIIISSWNRREEIATQHYSRSFMHSVLLNLNFVTAQGDMC